jgi:dCTP deaminase
MAVLGHTRLLDLLHQNDLSERLIITPLLDEGQQVNEASIDVRLGNSFIVTRRGNLPCIDPAKQDLRAGRYQTKHFVNFHEPFYLHPQELVLGATLEYLRLPTSVAAVVTSRSRWGRAGLNIATATAVHPGFSGAITLELVNHGEVPLVLYPGIPIAQLVLYDCQGATAYLGEMANRTDAHYAQVADSQQRDLTFWTTKPSP